MSDEREQRAAAPGEKTCPWCAEGPPEWSYATKVWIHRRERLDRRCMNPPNDYGYTTQGSEETISSPGHQKWLREKRDDENSLSPSSSSQAPGVTGAAAQDEKCWFGTGIKHDEPDVQETEKGRVACSSLESTNPRNETLTSRPDTSNAGFVGSSEGSSLDVTGNSYEFTPGQPCAYVIEGVPTDEARGATPVQECGYRKALAEFLRRAELADVPGYIGDATGWECGECAAMDGSSKRPTTAEVEHDPDCYQGGVEIARKALSAPCGCEQPREPRMCAVCAGQPLASGAKCICGGEGTEDAEIRGLRLECNQLRSSLTVVEAKIALLEDQNESLKKQLAAANLGWA